MGEKLKGLQSKWTSRKRLIVFGGDRVETVETKRTFQLIDRPYTHCTIIYLRDSFIPDRLNKLYLKKKLYEWAAISFAKEANPTRIKNKKQNIAWHGEQPEYGPSLNRQAQEPNHELRPIGQHRDRVPLPTKRMGLTGPDVSDKKDEGRSS
ncbi:hypothetical protein QJS10_CPB21g00984 [Acorus calamus]|uniref:Uncharacterized protein n=1 Tax=Acorus calamus TaxID=4465 RepID=A0AAV9C6B9_ACOCL|nr:hypothetical protein QJS10_CPB21g00984 [Acorus calamus]